jgi:predicted nuclease of predicted toxin-antitoxin system
MVERDRLFVSLYLDEDVTPQLAALIRQRGFAATSAHEVGMIERPDEEHLVYATEHGWALLGYNQRDYLALAKRWAMSSREHTGIILSDQFSLRQLGELLRRILILINRVTADEMRNTVRYLADFR